MTQRKLNAADHAFEDLKARLQAMKDARDNYDRLIKFAQDIVDSAEQEIENRERDIRATGG